MGLRRVIYALGGAARRAGVAMDAAGSSLQGPTAYSECRMFVRAGEERLWLAEGRTCFLFLFGRRPVLLLSFVSYCSPPSGCGRVLAGTCGLVHWTILGTWVEEALLLADAAPRGCLGCHSISSVAVGQSKAFPFDCSRWNILGR